MSGRTQYLMLGFNCRVPVHERDVRARSKQLERGLRRRVAAADNHDPLAVEAVRLVVVVRDVRQIFARHAEEIRDDRSIRSRRRRSGCDGCAGRLSPIAFRRQRFASRPEPCSRFTSQRPARRTRSAARRCRPPAGSTFSASMRVGFSNGETSGSPPISSSSGVVKNTMFTGNLKIELTSTPFSTIE